jgi:hypothetical protein
VDEQDLVLLGQAETVHGVAEGGRAYVTTLVLSRLD